MVEDTSLPVLLLTSIGFIGSADAFFYVPIGSIQGLPKEESVQGSIFGFGLS